MQSQSTPLKMENVRRVLGSRFEGISKIQTYSTTQERKILQLGQRSSTKESAENVESMDIHLTIALTTNKTDSIHKHKTKVTTGPEALMINLPKTENIQQDLQLVRMIRSHRAQL